MTDRAGDRSVFQLDADHHASKHQSAAAHVAAADKRRRKDQPLAEDWLQHLYVLPGRDAAEQHDLAVRPDGVTQRSCSLLERTTISGVGEIDAHLRERLE